MDYYKKRNLYTSGLNDIALNVKTLYGSVEKYLFSSK